MCLADERLTETQANEVCSPSLSSEQAFYACSKLIHHLPKIFYKIF